MESDKPAEIGAVDLAAGKRVLVLMGAVEALAETNAVPKTVSLQDDAGRNRSATLMPSRKSSKRNLQGAAHSSVK